MTESLVSKEFHIGDILSITHDILVSPSHIGGVYNILNWMTGENLMAHQLVRASKDCKGSLGDQHPDLAMVDMPRWDLMPKEHRGDAVETWLGGLVIIVGETRPVIPFTDGKRVKMGPIEELKLMRPDSEIVPIRGGN